jgi:integrase
MDSLPIRVADGPLASLADRASVWVGLEPDERKRRAALAARDYDQEVLVDLTLACSELRSTARGGLSPHTVRAYAAGVRAVIGFASESASPVLRPRGGASWGSLYVRRLAESGASPSTVQVRLTAGRHLYVALRWAGVTEADPFLGVSAPKDLTEPMDKRREYSKPELEALLAASGARETVAVLLGAHGGLRIGEAAQLMWGDVDLDSRTLRVSNGKGGKTRLVTASRSLCAALDAHAKSAPESDVLVLGLKTRGLRSAFERLCRNADVVYRGFHALRHSAGHRVFSQLNDLGNVAEHLGHTSLNTARRYAKRSDALRKAIEDW